MPTTRPRHQVTETPAIAHAIDVAAKQWPNESRSRLLLRLVTAGAATLSGRHDSQVAARRSAVMATSGKYTELFHEGYLADLRADWPE